MQQLDSQMVWVQELIFVNWLKSLNTSMKIFLSRSYLRQSLELLIDCITCLMPVFDMILKRNCGFICIWIETINILGGEMMENNTLKRIQPKKRRTCIDMFHALSCLILYIFNNSTIIYGKIFYLNK